MWRAARSLVPNGETLTGRIMQRSTLSADYSWVWDVNGQPLPDEETAELELSHGNADSPLRFWASVLLLAGGRSHAASVQFFPDLGENCLFATVDGGDYELVPPPKEFRDWLLRAGRNFFAGSTWRGILWGWKARMFRCQSRGLVTLEWLGPTGRSYRIEWTGVFSPKGLVFQRKSELCAIESDTNTLHPQSDSPPDDASRGNLMN